MKSTPATAAQAIIFAFFLIQNFSNSIKGLTIANYASTSISIQEPAPIAEMISRVQPVRYFCFLAHCILIIHSFDFRPLACSSTVPYSSLGFICGVSPAISHNFK